MIIYEDKEIKVDREVIPLPHSTDECVVLRVTVEDNEVIFVNRFGQWKELR